MEHITCPECEARGDFDPPYLEIRSWYAGLHHMEQGLLTHRYQCERCSYQSHEWDNDEERIEVESEIERKRRELNGWWQ